MASTYTAAGIELVTQGEQAGAWGDTTNTNWEMMEEMVGGVVSVALSTTSETLTTSDGASSDGRHAAIVFTGSPGGTCTVTVSPNDMQKIYFVVNNSDQTVSMTQGSGANVSIPAGSKKIVYCDGAGAGAAVVDLTTNLDISGLHLGGTEVTATATELNILDGVTATTAELNILDGVTSTAAELNILDGATLDVNELNILDGVTATTAELNILDGVTATAAELNILDGATLDVTELNYVDGVTSAIQTQLDAKAPLASPALTGTATAVNLTLSGDLTVNGTTTTVNSTNTVVSDALLELGNGTTGTPANDAGLVIERGDSNNAFIGFDESADKFIVGTGTFTGASTGDLTITTGTLVANIEGNVTGNLTGDVTGNADTATTLETARTIGGVSFNGSANINLPGVNTTGNQDTSGNAATATKWATGRTITLTGDVTGTSGSFDGSGNLSFATTIAANSVALGTDTTGNYVASITNGSYITGGNGGSEGAGLTLAVDATSANTASKVVARDASGNFSAGTITATLSGNASTSSSCSGNAATATKLATARTIGGVSFDGSANINLPGVNTTGNQDTSGSSASCTGNAATATTLATARTINGVSFNGSANITVEPYIEDDESTAATRYLVFTDDSTAGYKRLNEDSALNYNPSTNVLTAGSFTASSDENLKKDIAVVEGALDKLFQLRGVEFTWKENDVRSAGVIAQDVEKVLPQVVTTTDNGYKTVQYDALHAVLIEAVKELTARVQELETKLN